MASLSTISLELRYYDTSQAFQHFGHNSVEIVQKLQQVQKAVSNWYDKNPSDNAPDVYMPEWSERIISYLGSSPDASPTKSAQNYVNLEELQFSQFFLEHPIAATSLYNVLQAANGLDKAICGASLLSEQVVQEWSEMRPFEYINSERVKELWKSSLQEAKTKFTTGITEDAFIIFMYDVRCGIDALEDAWAELKVSFEENLAGYSHCNTMLNQLSNSIAWKFAALDEAMKDDDDPTNIIDLNARPSGHADTQEPIRQRQSEWPQNSNSSFPTPIDSIRATPILIMLCVLLLYLGFDQQISSLFHGV